MQRNSHTSVVVTVLATCLGLLVIGVAPEIAARTVRDGVRYSTEALHSRLFVSAKSDAKASYKSGKIAVEDNSHFLNASFSGLAISNVATYSNVKALVEIDCFLLVTHLPRASLLEPPTIEPAAG